MKGYLHIDVHGRHGHKALHTVGLITMLSAAVPGYSLASLNKHDVSLAFGGRDIWVCPAVFPRGSPEFFTGAGASLRGCRGHFRKRSPPDPGKPLRKRPRDWGLSKRVNPNCKNVVVNNTPN